MQFEMVNRMYTLATLLILLVSVHGFPEEENYDPENRLFGGDMMLTPEQRILVETGGDISLAGAAKSRAAMKNVSILWFPNNKVVPYNILPELENEAKATLGIMLAFREWEERSCLTFKRRTTEEDYIEFFKESGCWSYVGRQGGAQNISLGEGCWGKGTVVHEIGHAMGFGHEQNRPDRDNYITIRWENIPEKKKHNFEKYSDKKVDSLNSPYDYKSFMQYSKTSFGINDSITLDPKDPNVFQLGQRLGFTERDQYQAMALYQCNGKTTRTAEAPKSYTPTGDDVCDFENGKCHYMQDKTDDFDWSQRYGESPSGSTGPETDHTTGRLGTYLYIEASLPRKKGDVARLKSKFFAATSQKKCLTFFYHMFSVNKTMMGKLNVNLRDAKGKNVIFRNVGSQNVNEWIEARINFTPTGRHQIIFEAIRGSGYQGDIALDDVSISTGPCVVKSSNTMKNSQDGACVDVNDREAQYCTQWKDAGYCSTEAKAMKKFCKKTCSFCH